VPLVVVRGLGPPETLIVLHHQPLKFSIKIIGVYGSGIESALQFGVATLSFLKIVRLSTLQIQPHNLFMFITDLNS